MNKLLERQLRRTLPEGQELSPEMKKLLLMVSDSYDHHERDRLLIERAMEISSEELRENYEELQKQEALKRANLKLQQFVSIASHDLKAPLRTVGAFTQLLNRKVKEHLDDSGREYVNFILEGVERMNTLIEDLTCFSRIDIQNEEPTLIDTNIILEKVKHNLHALIEESKGKIIVERTLPHISALDFQILQLFQNLIGNALKFKGDQDPEIKISWEEQENGCCFKVQDNGIGISPENKAKVFEVFQRLNNTADYEGSGLGLSICKKVMDSLGGEIWLESEMGNGVTFFFTVPKEKIMIPTLV